MINSRQAGMMMMMMMMMCGAGRAGVGLIARRAFCDSDCRGDFHVQRY